ncbi:MAG TPA: DUF58 domain-containing protein [Gemmatimonadaceae bacterium]|nr:DUF58 domain-containing protein [Gemmatimonadaceae bacterium]
MTVDSAVLLDPTVLARIGNLELLARTVVEGFVNGLHRSPHLGSSTDFAEHRSYMPGDDIRAIDWRLYARTDRYYVKQFEADTNANFVVLLDVSPSMRYRGATEGPGSVSKLDYGCFLAAALSYFSSTQRDRVGLATFDEDIVEYVPPSAKHLRLVLHALERTAGRAVDDAAAPRASTLDAPLRKLTESLRRRSIVLLISDLYEEPDAVLSALANVRGRGSDLIVFHLLDRHEIEFPFADATNFVDLETGERMPVIPDYLRAQYRKVVAEHTATLERRMREQRVDYALFDTSKPLDHALFTYLLARERFSTVR